MCSKREGCYKEGAATKSYSLTIKFDLQKEQMAFEETDYFEARAKEVYKLKQRTVS